MSILSNLRERRSSLVSELSAITRTAMDHGRDLTVLETEKFTRTNDEIDQLDERIKQLAGQERRAYEANATYADIMARPVTGGSPSGSLSESDRDIEPHRGQLD